MIRPVCASPVVSITGVRKKRSIASATKPSYHARRAASIWWIRSPPAASASRTMRA